MSIGFFAAGVALAFASLCAGQVVNRVDLGRQGKNPDFSTMQHTRPLQTGIALPATCQAGEMFFKTNATTPGGILYGCQTTNTWSRLGIGECSILDGNLQCPGDIWSGSDGSAPGEIELFEDQTLGVDFISIKAPASLTTTYRLELPSTAPAGQLLSFGAPSGGISTGSWVARPTKVIDSVFRAAARRSGAAWVLDSGWSLPDSNAPTVTGTGTGLFRNGFLQFAAGSKQSILMQTALPSQWNAGPVSLRLVWMVNSGVTGGTVKWEASAVCAADGANLSSPVFPTAQSATVTVPFPADTNSRRITTTIGPLTLTGCQPNDLLYILIDRDGASDTNTTAGNLFGAQLEIEKVIQ
jgi:hypothetical protein